jgi:glycosyl transferase family 25
MSQQTRHPDDAAVKAVLAEFFDRIYVLSLRRCEDRHALIKAELEGLPFDFFWGVDGKSLTPREVAESQDAAAVRAVMQRDMSTGEVACSLSHRRIYEDALAHGYRRVLILEDDVKLLPVAVDVVRAMIAELPAAWDLWYLGYAVFNDGLSRRLVRRAKELACPLLGIRYGMRYTRGHSRHLRRAGFHNGAFTYALTAAGCEKLVRAQTPVCNTADGVMSFLCADRGLEAFLSVPMLFAPAEILPTTIDDRHAMQLRAAAP